MESKLLLGIFCCLFIYSNAQNQNGGAVKFEVGGKHDASNIKTLFNTMNKTPDDSESGDGSGDDDTEIYSGSGSGEPEPEPATEKPTLVPTKKKLPTTKIPTTKESKSTVMVINEVEPTKKEKVTEENDNEIVVNQDSTEDPSNTVGASRADPNKTTEEEAGVDFTVGIIVGVVVGAILAILVIVFLVYRLRKKDEGSYSLDEPSSQAFIRDEKNSGGQGKEYFA